ncbi:MAG: ParA family protein [Acidobacteria bacterium]|nr:ParA family protein [Acidobacteriota bacterium]
MRTIAVANPKGGVGKTLCAILANEYFFHQGVPVLTMDADSNGNFRFYLDRCTSEGRLEHASEPRYRIVDTAGLSAASVAFLREADIILVPTRLATPDLTRLIRFLRDELDPELLPKVAFVPNAVPAIGLTKEMSLGFDQLREIAEAFGLGRDRVLPGLCLRPAVYGLLYNGSSETLFDEDARGSQSLAHARRESAALMVALTTLLEAA